MLGSILMLCTTFVHAGGQVAAMWGFRKVQARRWAVRSLWTEVTLIAALVLMMFYAALLEALLWAVTYLGVGAIAGLEPALYFSIVTYTTLGYGDVVLNESWRLLASFEAANGIIMFGWTTALIVAFVQRLRQRRLQDKPPHP